MVDNLEARVFILAVMQQLSPNRWCNEDEAAENFAKIYSSQESKIYLALKNNAKNIYKYLAENKIILEQKIPAMGMSNRSSFAYKLAQDYSEIKEKINDDFIKTYLDSLQDKQLPD